MIPRLKWSVFEFGQSASIFYNVEWTFFLYFSFNLFTVIASLMMLSNKILQILLIDYVVS